MMTEAPQPMNKTRTVGDTTVENSTGTPINQTLLVNQTNKNVSRKQEIVAKEPQNSIRVHNEPDNRQHVLAIIRLEIRQQACAMFGKPHRWNDADVRLYSTKLTTIRLPTKPTILCCFLK